MDGISLGTMDGESLGAELGTKIRPEVTAGIAMIEYTTILVNWFIILQD